MRGARWLYQHERDAAGQCQRERLRGGGAGDVPTLQAGGSSTVYPIVDRAASFWGTNAAPPDGKYWKPKQYGIETEERLADYWAGMYGFDATETDSPPVAINVSLSHSGTGLEKLRNGRLDIGNSSAPVKAEFPDLARRSSRTM